MDPNMIAALAAVGLLLVGVAKLAYQVGKDIGEARRRGR